MFNFSSLEYSSEYPGLFSMLLTVISCVGLSTLVAFTYEKTSHDVKRPDYFIQSLVLVSIVAAIVMQAIGDSVARGLGMIGALSIIRFRTTIKNPRNIVFMFSSIAIGIACGVLGIGIAIIGTLAFCSVAFVLRYSPFNHKEYFIGSLKVTYPIDSDAAIKIDKILKSNTKRYQIKSTKIGLGEEDNGTKYTEYFFALANMKDSEILASKIQAIDDVNLSKYQFTNHFFDDI